VNEGIPQAADLERDFVIGHAEVLEIDVFLARFEARAQLA